MFLIQIQMGKHKYEENSLKLEFIHNKHSVDFSFSHLSVYASINVFPQGVGWVGLPRNYTLELETFETSTHESQMCVNNPLDTS